METDVLILQLLEHILKFGLSLYVLPLRLVNMSLLLFHYLLQLSFNSIVLSYFLLVPICLRLAILQIPLILPDPALKLTNSTIALPELVLEFQYLRLPLPHTLAQSHCLPLGCHTELLYPGLELHDLLLIPAHRGVSLRGLLLYKLESVPQL